MIIQLHTFALRVTDLPSIPPLMRLGHTEGLVLWLRDDYFIVQFKQHSWKKSIGRRNLKSIPRSL